MRRLAVLALVLLAAGCKTPASGTEGATSSSTSSSVASTTSGSGSHGSSGGSSGASSSGTTGGASSGSGTTSGAAGTSGGTGDCMTSTFLQPLGVSHLLVGAAMEDATASANPFDLRYQYLSGGLPDGSGPCASCASGCTSQGTACDNQHGCGWWGCWQWDQVAPGQFVVDFVSKAKGNHQIPMITYYELLQSSGVSEGAPEVTSAANNAAFMARYLADFRFLLQKIGSEVAFVHIEPDFWGYAAQVNLDPTQTPAAVASANPTDCGSQPNTIAGLGHCMIGMVRTYAPNARVGLHASDWGTNMDVFANTNPSFDVEGEARKLGNFLKACGADQADYVATDASDRDAAWYQTQGRNTWWDATNATLPNFTQALHWSKVLAETVGRPVLWWQTPVGDMALDNTSTHWRDNRVDYFFDHPAEYAAAHAAGIAFGAGADGQTTPESDNGHLASRVQAYSQAGGQPACP